MSVQVRTDINTKPFIFHSGPASVIQDGVIAQDAGRSAALAPYTVLGEKKNVATSITADVGNTGNGTFTALALTQEQTAKVGTWNVECTLAGVTHGGRFKLEDPDGLQVGGDFNMSDVAGDTLLISAGGIEFLITDGTTNFIAGDKAAIVIGSASGYLPLEPDAVNGLQNFAGFFLMPEVTAAAIVAGAITDNQILKGDAFIDEDQIVFENSVTLATVLSSGKTLREEMESVGLRPTSAIDFSAQENT